MQIYCVHKLGKERLPKLQPPAGIDLLFAAMCVINRPNSLGTDPPHVRRTPARHRTSS